MSEITRPPNAPAPQPQWSAELDRTGRRVRIAATLTAWAVAVPLVAWVAMLIVGATGAGVGYPAALAFATVGTLAVKGAAAEWRTMRDGPR